MNKDINPQMNQEYVSKTKDTVAVATTSDS